MVLKLKTPWRDGTTHLVLGPDARQSLRTVARQTKGPSSARERPARLSPLEFMQRLAALVPRPLAGRVGPVARPLARHTQSTGLFVPPARRLHLNRFHGVLAPNTKLRAMGVPREPVAPAQTAPPAESEANSAHHPPVRLSWARLLKRVLAAT